MFLLSEFLLCLPHPCKDNKDPCYSLWCYVIHYTIYSYTRLDYTLHYTCCFIVSIGAPSQSRERSVLFKDTGTANLRTTILDFRGFYSSVNLILRGGIPRPIGNYPDILSQRILVGIMLVGKLGIHIM